MRLNEPITDHEVLVPENQTIVSRTDTGGRITFVNKTFCEVSGFSEEELIGKPHNIVRHPHMPKEGFANLWATIKSGQPWDGLVKNRAKSGDFYWVRANVTPVTENGAIVGYVSIRERPSREEIACAEAAYARIRSGQGHGLSLRNGALVTVSFRSRLADLWQAVGTRLVLLLAAVVLGLGVVAAAGDDLPSADAFRLAAHAGSRRLHPRHGLDAALRRIDRGKGDEWPRHAHSLFSGQVLPLAFRWSAVIATFAGLLTRRTIVIAARC